MENSHVEELPVWANTKLLGNTMSRLKVTLVRSGIGRPEAQKKILKALGLTKMHRTVIRQNTPTIRGMVKKVIHLVRVEEVPE